MSSNGYLSFNIKAMRKSLGLSQLELAKKSGVSLHTVFRAESKGTVPRFNNLKKIAKALDTTEADLLKEQRNNIYKNPPNTFIAYDEDRRVKITVILEDF